MSRSFNTNVGELRPEMPSGGGGGGDNIGAFPRVTYDSRPEVAEMRAKIEGIAAYDLQQEQGLETLRQLQQQLMANPIKDGIAQLQEQQTKMRQQIDLELKQLAQIVTHSILEPRDLNHLRILVTRLNLQLQQLELYRSELAHRLNNAPSSPWYERRFKCTMARLAACLPLPSLHL
jgi:uncharacterized membrane protein YccC